MSAQDGGSLVLGYGPQGERQDGASVVLEYSDAGSGRRRVVSELHVAWGASRAVAVELRAPYGATVPADSETRAPWGKGRAVDTAQRHPWQRLQPRDVEQRAPWGRYAARPSQALVVPWVTSRPVDLDSRAPWGRYAGRLAMELLMPWGTARPVDIEQRAPWGRFLSRPGQALVVSWVGARPVDAERRDPWTRYSRQLNPDWGVVIPGGEPPVDEHGTVIVPVRRVYMTVNEVILTRVSTGVELRAHGFSMSLDEKSWTWNWSASLHANAGAHLARESNGDPAELEVAVNGTAFRLRLERIIKDRRFPQLRWSVSGRGQGALLASPRARKMTFANSNARTAQQLMDDVLTINGVPIGWAVDFGLTDWLVPAGAWSFYGTYIEAINDIASAVGGYVQPHATDQVLRILPRYPVKSWDWGSVVPDFEIPGAAAEVEGTEFIDKPAYNAVFLGGVGSGVFGPFRRAGSAGDVEAEQVTHALITDATAHTQRGIAELSDSGEQEHVTLSLMVLPETGVITPGKFVRYAGDTTVLGLVRDTAIDASRFPVVRQTIKLETHV